MFERLMVEDLVHWARDYKVNTDSAQHNRIVFDPGIRVQGGDWYSVKP
jgi:hypothetical protein